MTEQTPATETPAGQGEGGAALSEEFQRQAWNDSEVVEGAIQRAAATLHARMQWSQAEACAADLRSTFAALVAQARDRERERIAAWLRTQCDQHDPEEWPDRSAYSVLRDLLDEFPPALDVGTRLDQETDAAHRAALIKARADGAAEERKRIARRIEAVPLGTVGKPDALPGERVRDALILAANIARGTS